MDWMDNALGTLIARADGNRVEQSRYRLLPFEYAETAVSQQRAVTTGTVSVSGRTLTGGSSSIDASRVVTTSAIAQF